MKSFIAVIFLALMIFQAFAIILMKRDELDTINKNFHNKIASDKINLLNKFTNKPDYGPATTTTTTSKTTTPTTTVATTTVATTTPASPEVTLPTTAPIIRNSELYIPYVPANSQQQPQQYLPPFTQYPQMSYGGGFGAAPQPLPVQYPAYPEMPSFFPPAPYPYYRSF